VISRPISLFLNRGFPNPTLPINLRSWLSNLNHIFIKTLATSSLIAKGTGGVWKAKHSRLVLRAVLAMGMRGEAGLYRCGGVPKIELQLTAKVNSQVYSVSAHHVAPHRPAEPRPQSWPGGMRRASARVWLTNLLLSGSQDPPFQSILLKYPYKIKYLNP